MLDNLKHLQDLPMQISLSLIAVVGGVARYASNYRDGAPFRWGMLFASVFASGFAGVMFGLVGISMQLPEAIIFMMAGTGGFFADQSLKFVLDWITNRTK